MTPPTHKLVNGVAVPLTAAEIATIQAEWDNNLLNRRPTFEDKIGSASNARIVMASSEFAKLSQDKQNRIIAMIEKEATRLVNTAKDAI